MKKLLEIIKLIMAFSTMFIVELPIKIVFAVVWTVVLLVLGFLYPISKNFYNSKNIKAVNEYAYKWNVLPISSFVFGLYD